MLLENAVNMPEKYSLWKSETCFLDNFVPLPKL